jgi:hypothetical protein
MNDDAPLIRGGYDLPPEAECAHCGKAMVLVENLYYVHVDTKFEKFCQAALDNTQWFFGKPK